MNQAIAQLIVTLAIVIPGTIWVEWEARRDRRLRERQSDDQ